MPERKTMTESQAMDGDKLWDEIFKAVCSAMPSQFFPLFKEVYGRDYPKDTPIVVLGSETSSIQENPSGPPKSSYMDIALLVAGTDYYHLECQMKNEKEMVIRMFVYDVRFAITHTKTMDSDTGEITLYFPHSVVIYPEKNDNIPEHLKCRVVFQDNSEHIYSIPTVKIQTYSLKEIRQKHLTFFIPYTILRLRPRLKSKGSPLTQKELTEFVEEAILVLKEELTDGYLTELEYHDYVRLFHLAVDRVLAKYSEMRQEVRQMIETSIKLPSMIVAELQAELQTELADQRDQLAAQRTQLAVQRTQLADQGAQLADQRTQLAAQRELVAKQNAQIANQREQLANQKAELADKDAEIQRLQELVKQLSSK